ncbi:MAG TPA: hypothetical protein VK898_22755, partial [Chloroflexota bacterium]|nr:hypothetical protein [Chloroflexota bacterium]
MLHVLLMLSGIIHVKPPYGARWLPRAMQRVFLADDPGAFIEASREAMTALAGCAAISRSPEPVRRACQFRRQASTRIGSPC